MADMYPITWWHFPAVATVVLGMWSFFWPVQNNENNGAVMRASMIAIAVIVSSIVWILFGGVTWINQLF